MKSPDIEQIKKALETSPENIYLRELYIGALMESKDYKTAESELIQIIKQEPRRSHYKYLLAQCYYSRDKVGEALVVLEEIMNNPIVDADIYTLYIKILIEEEKIEKAAECYAIYRERYPDNSDPEIEDILENYTDDDDLYDDEFDEDDEFDTALLEKPDIDFSRVGGMEAVKEQINMKIIAPLKHPDLFQSYGKKAGGGILLYGPPGCGKTYIAKATAGEIDALFINVGINYILDMYIGRSEKKLHEIFEYARKNTPCVLFFDEIDALGASRSDMRNSGSRNLINQFLVELDGIDSQNDEILVLGATNAPWYIDSAFKRAGRFDNIVFIPPPDEEARKTILEIILKDKPAANIDYKKIAKVTERFSGADLKLLVNNAIEEKLKEVIKGGKESMLDTANLVKAAKKLKPTTTEWLQTARNYAVYSNKSGLYEDLKNYLGI